MPTVRDEIAAAYEDPSVLQASLPLNPSEVAANLRESARTGIPAPLIPDYKDSIQASSIFKAYQDLAASSPRSYGWASQNAYNAALLRDALEQTARIEAAFQKAKKEQERAARPLSEKVKDAATGAWVAAGSIIPQVAEGVIGAERMFADLFINPTARALQRALGVSEYSYSTGLAQKQAELKKLTQDLTKVAGEKLVAGGVPESITPGVVSGFQTMGTVAQMLLAPATVLPTITAQVGGSAYGEAKDKDLSTLRSALYAVEHGLPEYAFERWAIGDFLKTVGQSPEVRAGVGGLLKSAIGAAAKDIWAEQLTTAVQDLSETATLHPEKTLGDYLVERPDAALQTLVATLVGGGGMITVSAAVDQINRAVHNAAVRTVQKAAETQAVSAQARAAEMTFGRLKDMTTAANEHALRQLYPDKFREFLNEVAQDSDLAEVYVDATALNEVLKQTGTDINLLKTQMPDVVVQMQEGLANEGVVRIGTADLLTYITNPSLQNALLPLLKQTPDGMNYNEAQAFFQTATQEMEKQAAVLAEQVEPVLTREDYEAQLEDAATTEEVQQLAAKRIEDLSAIPPEAVKPEQMQELAFLTESAQNPEALAQHFGVRLVKEKPTYTQYLKTRTDKAAARAVEVENLRREITDGMRAMNRYTESVIQAYATPLTNFYQVNSAKMGLLPSELMEVVPIRFMAERISGVNPTENNKATRDVFTKDGIHNVLQKSDWAILTAENPRAEKLSAEENAARNAALEEDLKAGGYEYIKVNGVYDRPDEKSFIVLGIAEDEASAFGVKYGQDSILTREGLIYHDGRVTKAVGVTVHNTRPQAYYTTLPDGTMFTIELKMDEHGDLVKESREPVDPANALLQSLQLRDEIASREIPEGPLSAQDTRDLRLMWERYVVSEGKVAQYGTSDAKADDPTDVKSALANLEEIMNAVYARIPDEKPELKDISHVFWGERFPKGQGYAIAFTRHGRPLRTGDVFVDLSDKTIQVNMAQWGEGGRGSAVYKSLFDFARNNGFKFIGDTAGISVAGMKRRLENMLSHALQTNDVSYMALHPDQVKFIEKETGVKIQWLANDAEKTIEQMLNASYNLTVKDSPEIRNVYFDFTQRLFVDSRTGRTDRSIDRLVAPSTRNADVLARKGKAGSSTLARTALANTILRTPAGRRHLVLREVARFSMELLPGARRLLYQQAGDKPGAVNVVGHHFSTARRAVLDGRYYGSGIKGAEARRVVQSKDSRIRERVHFYVDEGNGVFPEAGVGREEHIVPLNNLYDAARNPLKIPAGDANAFESAVLDAGFSGYYVEGGFGRQGVAVLLGEASRNVSTDAKTYAQSATQPTFYSALTRAVEGLKQTKGDPDQWIGIIKNLKGVKKDELVFTGVLDWLETRKSAADYWAIFNKFGDEVAATTREPSEVPEGGRVARMQPSKSVTREEIVAFLNDNMVRINPVIKQGDKVDFDVTFGDWTVAEPDEDFLREDAEQRLNDLSNDELEETLAGYVDEEELPAEMEALQAYLDARHDERENMRSQNHRGAQLYDRLMDDFISEVKDSYYEDPDAPRSRVVRVIADNSAFDFIHDFIGGVHTLYSIDADKQYTLAYYDDVEDTEVEELALRIVKEDIGVSLDAAKWKDFTLGGEQTSYQERLLLNASHKGEPFIYGEHWEEENVAAFTRVSTRYVPLSNIEAEHPALVARLRAEGKTAARVYFLEEVQSDWAQQGREKKAVYEQRPYTLDMLSLNDTSKKELDEKLSRYSIRPTNVAPPGEPENIKYVIWSDDKQKTLPGEFDTEEEAMRAAVLDTGIEYWYINSSDGQIFRVRVISHPTPEKAMQYVASTKTYSVHVGEITKFELNAKRAMLEKEQEQINRQLDKITHEIIREYKEKGVEPTDEDLDARILPLTTRRDEIRKELSQLPSSKIAKAPFVTTTDAWVALALKDALRVAAEGDYDLISWTTGSQQTERWSRGLRKRVDRIQWEKSADGFIHIKAQQEGFTLGNTRYSENELTTAIGKTMAERIINDPNQSGEIAGEQIVVADLGMSYFYGDVEGLNPEGKPAIITKVADQLAKQFGAPPVRGLTFHPTETKDEEFSSQPVLEVTPEIKQMALQGLPLFQQKLAYFDPEKMMITMLKGANLSSMIHESGHFYLEALATMSAHPKATQQMKDDFDKTLKWFNVPDRNTWDRMTLEQKRPLHEMWAQSFERWTLEGKAPTVEMQPVFARFRAWMLSVYKSLEQFLRKNPLAGKLNDEVRGVFARLIASEEAIKEAEAARAFVALAKPEGMSDEEYQNYVDLGKEATQTAVSEMSTRTLRDMKWLSNAKHKAIRRMQREAATKRKAIREEVTKEVMQEPVNQVRTFLTKGTVIDKDGNEIPVAVENRIDAGVLKEMYPESMQARPDLTKLRGMTSADNGVHPDIIASMFGFQSGDAMVRELIEAEPAKEKIDALTDQRMLERYGELIDAEGVERAAEAAIHNEARARFLATGLIMLTKSKAPARELAKAAKEAAQNIIARKKVRDLKPKQYSTAETRANKKALELVAKNPAQAADAQRAALLNNRLAAAAIDALDEVDKALRMVEKFKSDGVRKNLDLEYLEQIDDLLKGFDFRKGESLKAIDKRRSFAEFVARQEEMGFEPIVSADQMEALSRKHYKDMTVEELRGLVETVKHIEHLGRLKKKLLTAKDAREFTQRIAEAVASIEANANRTVKEHGTPSDVAGQLAATFRGFAAEHRKAASLIREMDGSKDGGVMWDLFIRPMNEAGDVETEMRAEAAQKLAELFAPIRNKMGGIRGHLKVKRMVVPGTKLSMSYEERVMFALNWGNEGNRQRLLDGGLTGNRALTQEQAQAVLDTLDKQDWDFVQGVWDYLDTFRPQVAALERALTGKEPQWVDAAPVETKFGVYRGGYFPAKYDAELSTRSEALEAATTLRMGMKGAFGNAGTRNGYTKKRADEVKGRPLLLSFNVITQHVGEVTHRLAWQRWIVDANRILRALDGPVRDNYGPEVLRELKKLVEDVAAGDAPATTHFERIINHLRSGSTIVGMGWRVTTAMLQPSGLAQSWVRVGGKWVAMGVKKYLASPIDATEFAESRSKLLRDRNRTLQREVNEILNTVRVGDKLSNVQASYFWLIAKMQRVVDIPTWLGAYEKAVAQLGLESAANEQARAAIEEKAAAMADQAVLDAQSGGQIKDLARIQRGSPLFKLFTNFYSYFSATYNLNVEAYRRTNFKDPVQVGQFAADVLILNTVPVLFAVALKELLKGGCDDDDVACLLKQVGQEQTSYLFGQMVLLREVGEAVGAMTGDSFGYAGPSGLRFFSDLYKAGEQVSQGEADFAAWKAATNALAIPLHLPMGQVNTTLEGIVEVEKGNVDGVSILPALVAGKPREEK